MSEIDPWEATQRAQLAERDAQLDAVAGIIHADHPRLNLHGFLRLAGTLDIYDDDGGMEVYPTRDFALTASDQVLSFMEDPRQLINDMGVVRYASELLADEDIREAYPIAAAAVDVVAEGLTEGLAHGEFKDLKAPVIDRWFAAIDDAEDREAAADTVEASGVLQRTLLKIAHKDPIRFIDRLHSLAMRGLQPDDKVASALTLKMISDILKVDPMAACSLVQGSYLTEEPKKAGMQRRAMDLVISLDELLGVNMASYYSHNRYNQELNGKDRHLLERHLVPQTPGGRVDWKKWTARTPEEGAETRAKFISMANTKDGEAGTIYGRIAHYRRRNSLIGRLFRTGSK